MNQLQPQVSVSSNIFSALRAKIENQFSRIGNGQFLIYPKIWRVNQLLDPQKSSYKFSLYPGQNGNDHPLDIRLDRNNVAAVSHIGLSIRKQDTTLTPTRYFAPYTFNDPNYFSGVPASGTGATEAEALENIYSGNWTMKISNLDVMRNVACQLFKWVPEKQTFLTGTLSDQVANEPAQWGSDLEEQGLRFVGDYFLLNGQQNNDIVIDLAPGDYTLIDGNLNSAGTAATKRNLLTATLFGWEIADAALAAPQYR